MPDRRVYVYRLDVIYPEGVDWRNPPEAWEEDHEAELTRPIYDPEDPGYVFRWPRERQYLSRSSAARVAATLTRYGATAEIVRSEPVVFGA